MSETILVVDDEREIADLVEVYLRSENYTVRKFYSALEALECVEQEELSLAILDVMLPEMDGSVPQYHAHGQSGGYGQDHGPDPGGG